MTHSNSWKNYVAAALLGLSTLVQAQAAPAASGTAQGEVRKVDKANGKITVKHGEIPALDMPAMTMVFAVRDAAVLDRVKPGDHVTLRVTNENGTLTITDLKAAP